MSRHIQAYNNATNDVKLKVDSLMEKYLTDPNTKKEELAQAFTQELGVNFYRKDVTALMRHLGHPEKAKELTYSTRGSAISATLSIKKEDLIAMSVAKVEAISSKEEFAKEVTEGKPFAYFTKKYDLAQNHTEFLCSLWGIDKPRAPLTFIQIMEELKNKGVDRDHIVKLYEEDNMGYAAIASHLTSTVEVKLSDKQVKRIIKELE